MTIKMMIERIYIVLNKYLNILSINLMDTNDSYLLLWWTPTDRNI